MLWHFFWRFLDKIYRTSYYGRSLTSRDYPTITENTREFSPSMSDLQMLTYKTIPHVQNHSKSHIVGAWQAMDPGWDQDTVRYHSSLRLASPVPWEGLVGGHQSSRLHGVAVRQMLWTSSWWLEMTTHLPRRQHLQHSSSNSTSSYRNNGKNGTWRLATPTANKYAPWQWVSRGTLSFFFGS